ncbi:MAG: sigma-54 dependent transcriptional regulator [Pelobacteraceae bacterium]
MDLGNISILYVEDDAALRAQISFSLKLTEARVIEAENGLQGLEKFKQFTPDLVVTDIRMPVMDGLEMVRTLRGINPELPIIVCTAFTETDYLIRAIELGVSAYLPKPLVVDDLLIAVCRLAAPITQRHELEKLKAERTSSLEAFLGTDNAMKQAVESASLATRCEVPLLIQGETGTGKSRLAFFIHRLSARKNQPFIAAHLAGIPENLVESALFGHEKGAFTGADRKRVGFFQAAHQGTLLLDDLDAIPLSTQAALLQAVESRSVTPLGQTMPIPVNVRIISASNRPLKIEVEAGRFRQDLYYRLRGLQIDLPPLRSIKDGLQRLVNDLVQDVTGEYQLPMPIIPDEVYAVLQNGSWPGNIRELRHVILEALITSNDELSPALLQSIIARQSSPANQCTDAGHSNSDAPASPHIDHLTSWGIRQALAATGGKRIEAARLMGVSYNTFKEWTRRLGSE